MHIASMKEVTKDKKIEDLRAPDLLVVPLLKSAGSEPQPLVKAGDHVDKYQLIAESPEKYSARVHSPVSGTVKKVARHLQIDGSEVMSVIIHNDKKETETSEPLYTSEPQTPGELLKVIEDAGVVGLGGAQFPAGIKFNIKDKTVNTFIINGAECEPYLTGDYALMEQHTKELMEGIGIIDRILNAKEIAIAFEKSNKDLEEAFAPFLRQEKYSKIRTQIVPDEYPQGGELQLAKTITGIEIPNDGIPLDKGIIISNVGTVYAVYNCIVNKKPLIERIITISGKDLKKPGNYRIRIGTPVHHILDICEIDTRRINLVSGGPMMSPQIRSFAVPIQKGTLGILAMRKEKVDRLNCIWCGYCVDVCPMLLMPMKYNQFYRRKKYEKLNGYNLKDCIECGSCEYICPSNVPLMESIKEGKIKLKELKDAAG